MEGISVQELRIGIDGTVHAAAADHALARAFQLAIGEEHRRKGSGGQDAAVCLHLRLLELQQTVSARMEMRR